MEENHEHLVHVVTNAQCQNKSVIVSGMWFVVRKAQVWLDVLEEFVLLLLEELLKK